MKTPIYPPRIGKDEEKKRFVALLARLLDEKLGSTNSNIPKHDIILSSEERVELSQLAEKAFSQRDFFISLSFIDGLIGRNRYSQEELREIFLSERKKRGYSRAVASSQWHQFVTRLGMNKGDLSTLIRAAKRMPFEHFYRMEERLLAHFDIADNVRDYLLRKIVEQKTETEELREKASNFVAGQARGIRDETQRLLEHLGRKTDSLSSSQAAGMTIVLANTSVLFTTRDWSVSGTMSSIAGGLVMAQGRT